MFITIRLAKIPQNEIHNGETHVKLLASEIVALRPRAWGTEIRDRAGWLYGTLMNADELQEAIVETIREANRTQAWDAAIAARCSINA